MSKVNDGGPAFPSNRDMRYGGMTLRQYAAIKLRVPNSGTDWLDEMIRTSLRDDLAAKAMQGYLSSSWQAKELDSLGKSSCEQMAIVAEISYAMADATIKMARSRSSARDSYAMADATIKARGASLMHVNPNEAPPGFEAVAAGARDVTAACDGCAFQPLPHGACAKHKCMGWERDDGFSVIFVPCTNKPATANFPNDDMGTPV